MATAESYAYETIGRDERNALWRVIEDRHRAGWRLVTSVFWRSLTGPEFDKTELVFERIKSAATCRCSSRGGPR